ncbi:hypothetical protein ACLK19_16730 [Escherichia coli]
MKKTPLMLKNEVKFSVVGYYLYGAPANQILCKGNFSCAHCVKLCQPYPVLNWRYSCRDLSRTLDLSSVTLDDKGRGEVSTESQWKETHSPLQVIFQVVRRNRASPGDAPR